MRGDMIGLVALDFVLRVIFRRTVPVALVVEILVMNPDDFAGHPPGLGIPTHMIAYGKSCHLASCWR
jgi:hypothetical protein